MVKAYAFGKVNEIDEMSYAIVVYDDQGEVEYASSGKSGFGTKFHAAAMAAFYAYTYLQKENLLSDNTMVYTNENLLVEALNSKIIQDELIRDLKNLGANLCPLLTASKEACVTNDLFAKGFSIFL